MLLLFYSVLSLGKEQQELKQQTHFDVGSAAAFVGVIFVSLSGLFVICSKPLVVPVNGSALLAGV